MRIRLEGPSFYVGKTGVTHLTLKLTHSHSLLHNREEGLIQIHEPNFMVTSPGVSSPMFTLIFTMIAPKDSIKTRLFLFLPQSEYFLGRFTSRPLNVLLTLRTPSFLLTSSLPTASFLTITLCCGSADTFWMAKLVAEKGNKSALSLFFCRGK